MAIILLVNKRMRQKKHSKSLIVNCSLFCSFSSLVYFWYSLIFLLMRGFVVSFCAACINDESKKPLCILREVPSHSWNRETKRFFNDLINETIALSGMRFFFLTRKLMLTVAGTIVTYELVLFQLHFNYTEKSTCQI